MSKTVVLLTLIILFLFQPVVFSTNGYTNVSVSEAKDMIDSNPSLVILDVRTLSEYESDPGHIRHATLIPHTELESRLGELDTDDEILVYCRSGGRSATASQILVDYGFSYVHNMLGGITDWTSAGYPVYVKYSSIQEAINIAGEGDSIFVSTGVYYENVAVNKSIRLVGESVTDTIIDGSGENQTIIEITADNFVLERFTVQNSSKASPTACAGIKILESNQCKIAGNYIKENKIGIFVVFSTECNITSNTVKDNGHGIALYNSSYVTVTANNLSENTVGISLALSSVNNIIDNFVSDSLMGGHGISVLSNSTKNTISNNSLVSNFHGLWLSSSVSNLILGNDIVDNILLGIEISISSNNTFYHNNIINNPSPVVVDNKSICTWDNGCEGNYWGNFNGTDFDGDGICDTPYIIYGNNTDYYPLLNLYWNPGDVNHDLKIDIFDAVLICGAYSSTPSDFNWNCHCDITEPYGLIDIFDVVLMAQSYGEEYIL